MTPTKNLKKGSIIHNKEFMFRERYSWFNEDLRRLEICPTRPVELHNEESFKECISPGREIDESAGEDHYVVTKVYPKSKFLIARRLPSKEERVKVTFDRFPEMDLVG